MDFLVFFKLGREDVLNVKYFKIIPRQIACNEYQNFKEARKNCWYYREFRLALFETLHNACETHHFKNFHYNFLLVVYANVDYLGKNTNEGPKLSRKTECLGKAFVDNICCFCILKRGITSKIAFFFPKDFWNMCTRAITVKTLSVGPISSVIKNCLMSTLLNSSQFYSVKQKQDGQLAPAYFSPNYKYFDQLLQTVKNKTTVLNLVFKEFLQTSIPPLISVL